MFIAGHQNGPRVKQAISVLLYLHRYSFLRNVFGQQQIGKTVSLVTKICCSYKRATRYKLSITLCYFFAGISTIT